ncbi:MAG: hypothetical protein ACRDA5_15225, partial [Clostridium sp.]
MENKNRPKKLSKKKKIGLIIGGGVVLCIVIVGAITLKKITNISSERIASLNTEGIYEVIGDEVLQ